VYSAAIPQRADMILERCTHAVATPFGVTGALPPFWKETFMNNMLATFQFGKSAVQNGKVVKITD